jgi:hypothetical protein
MQVLRQRALVAEHARDPAHLRDELDQAIVVDGGHRSRDGVSHSCVCSIHDLASKSGIKI